MTGYLWRILAVAFQIGNVIYITSFIGQMPKTQPFSWALAWGCILLLCVSALLGFLAGGEAAKDYK